MSSILSVMLDKNQEIVKFSDYALWKLSL